jgi:hypothetical protein
MNPSAALSSSRSARVPPERFSSKILSQLAALSLSS